jgi:Ca-activated chloride channel family protein
MAGLLLAGLAAACGAAGNSAVLLAGEDAAPTVRFPTLPPVRSWSPCRVTIVAPKGTEVLFGTVRLEAETVCPEGTGVAEVFFLVDGDPAVRATRPPYNGRFEAGESFSERRVEARLTDTQGRVSIAVVITPGSRLQETVRVVGTPIDRVELSLAVTDALGRPVHGLTKDDFVVSEKGSVQRVETVRPETRPLSIAVLVDVSSSVRDFWPRLRQAAPAFARTLAPDDVAKVVAFSGPAYLIQDFTRDPEAIAASLAGFRRWGGGTSLYDTLAAVGVELAWARGGRQAVILLTDGIDTLSRIDAPRLRNYLRRTDVTVDTLLMATNEAKGSPGFDRSRRAIEMLCRDTGGTVRLLEDFDGMERAFRELGAELQDRYYLAYHSDRAGRKSGWRSIEVRTRRPGLTLRARAGVIDRRDIAAGLTEDLKNGDATARRQAAEWLGRMRAPGAADALLLALDDRVTQVGGAAALALARMREPRAVPRILAMLTGHDTALGVAAGEALMTFGPAAVPDLIGALDLRREEGDEDAQVRILEVLANIGDGMALDAITRAAQPLPPMTAARDSEERERMVRRRRAEPRVRSWALWALGRLGRAESLTVLEKGSFDSDPDVREAADEGLVAVLGNIAQEGRLLAWAAWPLNGETLVRLVERDLGERNSGDGETHGRAFVQAMGGPQATADLLETITASLPPAASQQARDLASRLRPAASPLPAPR